MISGGRGGERRRGRRCRASGGARLGGEEEGVEAELLSSAEGRGVAGDGCYGERRRGVRSDTGEVKLVYADLPHPNLAEEDGYGGGGVKISAAGVSTVATRSRQ